MKALVIGATGVIGKGLVEQLLQDEAALSACSYLVLSPYCGEETRNKNFFLFLQKIYHFAL